MLVLQKVALYHNHVIVKESGSTKETPWHQDQAYYEIDGQQVKPFFLVTILVSKFCSVLERI